jgi:hypothetical protein
MSGIKRNSETGRCDSIDGIEADDRVQRDKTTIVGE